MSVARAPLEVRNLTKRFPVSGGVRRAHVQAVDDVSFELRPAAITALVGESGSGKSTVARLLARLHEPTAGTVLFEGADVSRVRRRRAVLNYRSQVQIIFQDPFDSLNPVKTIRHHLERPLRIHAVVPRRQLEGRVHELLRTVGLVPPEEVAAKYPHELSGGQRQRVVIAGALVMDPEVIVADEPVSMLDVSIRTELLRLMLDLRVERGLTYLFITHDLSLAWVIADRIAVMYLGKIMEIGPAETVIRSPRNPYTQALVSVAPSPDPPDAGTRARRTILEGETPDAAHVPTGCRFHPRCPLAFDRCTVEEPPLFDLGRGQAAACWLVEPGGVTTPTTVRPSTEVSP
jgi:peptide/nickel transport system ATP-binding protein